MCIIFMVNDMNENNELLVHVNKTVEMGVYSTTSLLNALKNRDNKIKHVLEEELKEYEKYYNESSKLLSKNDIEASGISLMTKMNSNLGIMFETMKDNSDSAIASMLIEGFTMGVVEMKGKIDKYKNVCKHNILKLSKKVLKFQENEIVKLKTFV